MVVDDDLYAQLVAVFDMALRVTHRALHLRGSDMLKNDVEVLTKLSELCHKTKDRWDEVNGSYFPPMKPAVASTDDDRIRISDLEKRVRAIEHRILLAQGIIPKDL